MPTFELGRIGCWAEHEPYLALEPIKAVLSCNALLRAVRNSHVISMAASRLALSAVLPCMLL